VFRPRSHVLALTFTTDGERALPRDVCQSGVDRGAHGGGDAVGGRTTVGAQPSVSQLSTMEALAEGGMERRGSVYDRIRSWLHTQAVQDLDQFKGEPIGKKVLYAHALAAEREAGVL
jgi:hypothetical protein